MTGRGQRRAGRVGRRVTTFVLLALFAALWMPRAAVSQPTTTRGFAPTVLPATIPIFPLQDVMLFPRATRPLHIFEPRYRDMVSDALAGDKLIGMVMLQPGFEADYEGRPPVFPVGTVGIIAESEELADGGYNIVLGGLAKFRITGEDSSRSYRLAHIELVPDVMTADDQTKLGDLREELNGLVPIGLPGIQVPDGLAVEDMVNGIAQLIDIDPLARLGLLEQPGSLGRAQALIDLMYIRAALSR